MPQALNRLRDGIVADYTSVDQRLADEESLAMMLKAVERVGKPG